MTRFNLATPGRESDLRSQPGWLAHRFKLFEDYCLPSVLAQTSQDFDWIIYFDDQTPQIFRERIEKLRKVFPFVPYFTGLFDGSGWQRSIRESFNLDVRLLLTTRLDNDDSLANDFVSMLHAAVVASDATPGCYNFRNGFVVGGGRLYSLVHEANPFFSVLEPVGADICTAPAILHLEIARYGAVHMIDGLGAWAQIVHGGNVSNKLRGRRVDPSVLGGRFPNAVAEQLRPLSFHTLLYERVVAEPLRDLRDIVARARYAPTQRRAG